MKVDSLSNYSPIKDVVSLQEKKSSHQVHSDVKESSKTDTVEFGLNSAERAMFASLFPDHAKQIYGYNSYTARGINVAVEPGQIINKKV
jgi:hypothetical protein